MKKFPNLLMKICVCLFLHWNVLIQSPILFLKVKNIVTIWIQQWDPCDLHFS